MKRNRKRKKLNNIMIISVCAVLLLMTAGYAAMSTNLEINAKGNVVKKATGGEALLDNVDIVTEGDGLYADSYEENVYTYRGANPNNYVTFNGEQWRIISVNTADNTIKIMRNAVLSDRAFDTSSNGRQDNQYCNYSYCNIYGSTSSLYNTSGSIISTLARQVNGTKYQLPSKESEMSTYLNGEYYNGLSADAKSMIKQDAEYKAGPIDYTSSNSLNTEIGYASEAIWRGKVALIDATEYIRASTYSSCKNMDNAWDGNCKNSNWMFNSDIWWTLSPFSNGTSLSVWFVRSSGDFDDISASSSRGVRPVLILNSNIQITGGEGTSSSPYTLGV